MGAMNQMTPAQINTIARAAIRARAVKMEQQIFSQTFTPAAGQNVSATQPIVNVQPRNVGLIMGFWVQVIFTVNNGSAVQIDLSDFGPSNVLTQIQFTDLANNIRVQTSGRHLGVINSVKGRRPFGTSLVRTTGFDDPINYGANWANVITAPATIAAAGNSTLVMWYYVPLAYSDHDYRGSVYANVVNATMQLALTFNPTPVVQNATDGTNAIFAGHAAGSTSLAVISAATINVWQVYLDQLPAGAGGVLLPILDLATIYELKETTVTGITPNTDFPYQYANFRDIVSTTATYINTGATGARGTGADINTWALQSANLTNIFKKTPALIAMQTRQHLQTDLPPGTYYFSSREKPISTVQYGNMQLVLNAITAAAGAYLLVGVEDFALVQALSQAGSLAAS